MVCEHIQETDLQFTCPLHRPQADAGDFAGRGDVSLSSAGELWYVIAGKDDERDDHHIRERGQV